VDAEEDSPLDRVPDDRAALTSESRVLLIVENDDAFARFLLEVARERGWQGVVASSGASAVALAREVGPHAVTLDMRLPDIDGWRLLRLFKADLETRHVPVLVISTDDEAERAYGLGAIGVLAKPVANRETLERTLVELAGAVDRIGREVLIVAGEDTQASLVAALAEDAALRVTCVSAPTEALPLLEQGRFDCVIVQPPTSARSEPWVEELERLVCAGAPTRRLVYYQPGAQPAAGSQSACGLRAATLEEALDAAIVLLHRRAVELPPSLRSVIESARRRRQVLSGRKVLLVDDDIRNIFALTSVLEKREMNVLSAESGQGAIELLEANPGVDVVLMDVMMPGMDGFETMREMRKRPQFRALPIIAVTARAMKGDREKTLRAGAWDYLAKPVEPERMLAVLEAWLQG
jgi:CheY-like chemotaxis protein